jgi:hypothetical protein
MATATAPRNDIYLSILAGRALTALADLAADSSAWSDRIQKELESGVEFCQAIRACQPNRPAGDRVGQQQAVRRLATEENQESPSGCLASDCDDVESLLGELLAHSRRPEPAELLSAIKFFIKDVGYLGS